MDEIVEKYCNHCDTTKPISAFARNRHRPDGYQHWCSPCRKAEYGRKYASNARQTMRKWYTENRDEQLAKQKEYADGRREEIRAYKRRYAKDHSKRLAEKTAAWREENPGRTQAWREANPDHSRRNHAARKARQLQLPHERVDLDSVRKRSKGFCWLCGAELTGDAAADHLIPFAADATDLAIWGLAHPGHVTANLEMACRGCNARKYKRLMLCAMARYLRNVEAGQEAQGAA